MPPGSLDPNAGCQRFRGTMLHVLLRVAFHLEFFTAAHGAGVLKPSTVLPMS